MGSRPFYSFSALPDLTFLQSDLEVQAHRILDGRPD